MAKSPKNSGAKRKSGTDKNPGQPQPKKGKTLTGGAVNGK